MKYRKLRIAWSVIWGVVAVLLVVLWVRSYWRADVVRVPRLRGEAISVSGRLKITRTEQYYHEPSSVNSFQAGTRAFDVVDNHVLRFSSETGFGSYGRRSIVTPHWFAIVLAMMLSLMPWVRRFSLRALLIATTVVAAVLGVINWAGG